MKTVTVIGAKGFVGSALVNTLQSNSAINVVTAVRGDDLEKKIKGSDYVIHTANPPGRFRAQNNPEEDFIECVEKTNTISELCRKYSSRMTLISSIAARVQLDTVYGMNRRSAELLALKENALVIRLGYMFSDHRIYGALKDIYENKDVYLSKESEYSFSDIQWNADKIAELTLQDKMGIWELGARGSVTLAEIAGILSSKSSFVGNSVDKQIASYTGDDNPEIDDFIHYLKKLTKGDQK